MPSGPGDGLRGGRAVRHGSARRAGSSSGSAALWGLVFTGFPYAVALKTGSPAAVNACFVIFFPLFFLTDAVIPRSA